MSINIKSWVIKRESWAIIPEIVPIKLTCDNAFVTQHLVASHRQNSLGNHPFDNEPIAK